MIKVVFLDIDGTVLSHQQGKVPESTKDAIYQMREKGIKSVCRDRTAYFGDGKTSVRWDFF